MSKLHWYRGYGLLFKSELDLPELALADRGKSDIRIALGTKPREAMAAMPEDTPSWAGFTSTPDGEVLFVRDVAYFLVRDGKDIVVDPLEDADPGLVRMFLIGSALGMLFHQRGQLVLHGSAIEHGTGLSVFVGESGAGKSTIAAHLGKRGHAVLADDTLPISTDGNGGFQAWPGSRVFKLWRDALENLGEKPDGHEQITNRLDKHFYRNPTVAEDRPQPIRDIIVLERSEEAKPRLCRVTGLEALKLININAYRAEYVPHLRREEPHFKLTAAVVASVPLLRLTRPWDVSKMDDVLERLEAHWEGAALDPPGTEASGKSPA